MAWSRFLRRTGLSKAAPYEFCFQDVAGGWRAEWDAIRTFTKVWQGVELAPSDSTELALEEAAAQSDVELPGALKEWVRFCRELEDKGKLDVVRDYPHVRWIAEHSTLSFLHQCEEDFYWAIDKIHLAEENPPVTGYVLDYDSPTIRFDNCGEMAPSLTGFMLGHMKHFVYTRPGGFAVDVDPTEAWLSELEVSFEVSADLAHMKVFENAGVVAFLYKKIWSESTTLLCHVLAKEYLRAVPDCVFRHSGRAWMFVNDFKKYARQ